MGRSGSLQMAHYSIANSANRYREQTAIVAELACYLFETEERLDPGRTDCEWNDLSDFDRAFYTECVWALLSRRSLLVRFFELPDRNSVVRAGVSAE